MRVAELCDLLTSQSTPEYVGDTWMSTCSWSQAGREVSHETPMYSHKAVS